MKNFKLKFLSLILSIIMCLGIFTGCALIVPNKTEALNTPSIKIDGTTLTKQDVADLWYSFYNENSSYFYMYDNDQIVDIFYKNVITKYAIIQETKKLMEDEVLVYTETDDVNVWLEVLDSVVSSVDTREKAILKQNGVADDDLPKRLQSSSSSSSETEKSYLYEDYEFKAMEDYTCEYLSGSGKSKVNYEVGSSVSAEKVNSVIAIINKYLSVTKVESEDDVKFDSISDLTEKLDDTTYFTAIEEEELANRDVAYQMYISTLAMNAKAKNENSNKDVVLYNQIKKLYVSCYETYLYNMYSSYIKSLITDSSSSVYALSNRAIISRYFGLLGKDVQSYGVEENYISVMEASATEAILTYTYKGENYYFSVQHLLVSFDDQIKEDLSKVPGSDSKASKEQYEAYAYIRENYISTVLGKTWSEYDNVTYRDEKGYTVYKFEDKFVYFDADYTPDNTDVEDDADKETQYYYTVGENKTYLIQSQFDTATKATITIGEMLTEFDETYNQTKLILEAGKAANKEVSEIAEELEAENLVKYVISDDFIQLYLDASVTEEYNVLYKIYTNLFTQHAFKYSADSASLGNDLSDRVGMRISERADNNKVGGSTYVSEFTNGARKILAEYLSKLDSEAFDADIFNIVGEINQVISDYGLHYIVINDVYNSTGSIVKNQTGVEIKYSDIFDETKTEAQVNDAIDDAIEILKQTSVTTASSQSVYEYIYEIIRDELVGSSGKVFTIERNKVYNAYMKDKVQIIDQMNYTELMNAIG